jgi:hypothetical protein
MPTINSSEKLRKVLWDVKTIGDAYRRGIIQINPAADGPKAEEARTLLDGMAAFAAEAQFADGGGQEHGGVK